MEDGQRRPPQTPGQHPERVFFSDSVGVKHLHSDHSPVVQITQFIKKQQQQKQQKHPCILKRPRVGPTPPHLNLCLPSVYCNTICTNKYTKCYQNFNSFQTASQRKNSPPLVPPIPKPSVHAYHFLRSSSVYWYIYQEGRQHCPVSTRRQRNTHDNLDPLARAASQLDRRPGFAPRAPEIVSPDVPQPNSLARRPGSATQSQGLASRRNNWTTPVPPLADYPRLDD